MYSSHQINVIEWCVFRKIMIWLACKGVYLQQDILIVILCKLILHKKLLLNFFIILYITFSKSVWYGNTARHTDCVKITFHSVGHKTDTTFQEWLSFTIYFVIIQQSLSNSETQEFRIIDNNNKYFSPGHCPDHSWEVYNDLYSGTGGVVEVGRDSSL